MCYWLKKWVVVRLKITGDPWSHHVVILDRSKCPEEPITYGHTREVCQ
jgi:hypothetical protein